MKIVQEFQNYLHVDFQQGTINAYEVIAVFCNCIDCAALLFLTSERNLKTLVKVNRLSKLIENCSRGSKLFACRISARYN